MMVHVIEFEVMVSSVVLVTIFGSDTAMICHGDHSFCLNNIDGEKGQGGKRHLSKVCKEMTLSMQLQNYYHLDLDHKDDELAQEPELSTSDTEEEQDISHSFQLELDSQQEQDNEKKSWVNLRGNLLLAAVRMEANPAKDTPCVMCTALNASIRCRNCSFASFFCLSCALMVHARINKTHYLERHDGKSWVDLGDASTELIASELKGDSLDHTNNSGQFPSPSQGVMLLQDFLPDCAMPREMCKTIIYDPDIDLSHVSELNYLSCKCCRVRTLLGLGLWAMSPSNPTSAVSLFSMKKLFKVLHPPVSVSRLMIGATDGAPEGKTALSRGSS
eukprot:g63826.t1